MKFKTPSATRVDIERLMNYFGVVVSYDEILNDPVIKGVPGLDGNDRNSLIAFMKDKCRTYKISKGIVDDQLDTIIESNVINPVRDWLAGITRTKTNNPVHELVDLLPVDNKEWVKIALYRWLIQCCAAADMAKHGGKHPDAIPKFESVLMMCGGQGLHKTSFVRSLLPEELHKYTKDAVRLNLKDRGSLLNVLRCWIPELVELDAKSEQSELNGFLSKEEDEIRFRYARKPMTIRRHVSCFATVNREHPPKGTTWNRRFLPIFTKSRLDYPRDAKFDYTDLWAFVWQEYTSGAQWWLKSEEEALQQESLSNPEDRALKDIIWNVFHFIDETTGEALKNRTIKMTNSQIIKALPKNIKNNRSNQMAVKRVLKGLGVKHKRRTYFMPPRCEAEKNNQGGVPI